MSLYYQLSNIAYQLQLPSITNRALVDEFQNVAIFVVWCYECPVGSHVDDGFWRDVQVLRHFAPPQIVVHLCSVSRRVNPYPGWSTYPVYAVWRVSHRDQNEVPQHALLIVIVIHHLQSTAPVIVSMDEVMPLWLQRRCFRWTGLFAPQFFANSPPHHDHEARNKDSKDWATRYDVTHAGVASLSQYVEQYVSGSVWE